MTLCGPSAIWASAPSCGCDAASICGTASCSLTFQAPSSKGQVVEYVEETRALVVAGCEGAHERKNGCTQLRCRSIHHLHGTQNPSCNVRTEMPCDANECEAAARIICSGEQSAHTKCTISFLQTQGPDNRTAAVMLTLQRLQPVKHDDCRQGKRGMQSTPCQSRCCLMTLSDCCSCKDKSIAAATA